MNKNFSLKSLKKIAKEEKRLEIEKENEIARKIINELEDEIIEDINQIIVKGLKTDMDSIQIKATEFRCLEGRRNLEKSTYVYIAEHFCRLYKKKGFIVEAEIFPEDVFYIFTSKLARWKYKYSLY